MLMKYATFKKPFMHPFYGDEIFDSSFYKNTIILHFSEKLTEIENLN